MSRKHKPTTPPAEPAGDDPVLPGIVAPDGEALPVLPLRWVRVSHKTPDHIAERYLYAGYGSNLALAQMGRRCPTIDIVGPGVLRNARLVFAFHLGILQDDHASVPVGVYKCTAADVAALDRYEALGRNYERILVTVECNGVAVRCFTYLKKNNDPEQPTERYWETCMTGYEDWQFDTRRLRHAREHARKNERPRGHGNAWFSNLSSPYDAGTYRSDEPIGSGTAESYNRQQIARRQTANRSPRPIGGRLGGASYIDERLSVSEFAKRVAATRIPSVPAVDGSDDPTRTSVANGHGQNVYYGRNGERWVRNPSGNGWIRAKE